ncbi:MAG TPA: metallophosphoesterase [Blastocatellia bacterium]|nr:metallophosphoesterase [Blastocatellia bacterium]
MPWTMRMTLMLALAGLAFQFYIGRKTTNALATLTGWPKKRIRLSAAAIALWVVTYPLVVLTSYIFQINGVYQSFQASSLARDALITYPFWIGVILAIQLALFFLVLDAARLLLLPVYKRHKPKWLRVEAWAVLALFCAGLVYVVARVYVDLNHTRIRRTELQIASLPKELDGFRIVQIADVQADGRTTAARVRRHIDAVNRSNPDLVLVAGDLVTSGTGYIEAGAAALGRIQSRHGVYACLGDHDFFSNRDSVTRNLEKNGITVLDNTSVVVPVGSTSLSLTGITNVYPSRPPRATLDTVEQHREHRAVNILLTHQPSNTLVDWARQKGYDVFLAGHTHGGQIVFPLPGFLLTGSSFETRYVSGFYKTGGMLVSINNGLGVTLAPVRYNAPAEVTLIVLKAVN